MAVSAEGDALLPGSLDVSQDEFFGVIKRLFTARAKRGDVIKGGDIRNPGACFFVEFKQDLVTSCIDCHEISLTLRGAAFRISTGGQAAESDSASSLRMSSSTVSCGV